ncbi:MAG: hypothetical protein GXP37_14250 [Chloroflexi bacterium]|nr:hypothetical protein [Chloroflexota bacterium]
MVAKHTPQPAHALLRFCRRNLGGFSLLLGLWLIAGWIPVAHAQGGPDAWQLRGGPVAFATQLVADPQSPDFLFLFLASTSTTNPDHSPTLQGQVHESWAPYMSNDGGDTWLPASNDLAQVQPTVLRMFSRQNGSILWVGTDDQGLWRSENGGRTWRPVLIPELTHQRVLALAQDSRQRLHLLTLDNTRYPDSHLYTSSDGGQQWTHRVLQRFSGDPITLVTDLVPDPFASDRLYAVSFGGVLITDDAGASWRQAAIRLPESSFPGGETVLAADPTQRGRLYLALRSTRLDGSDQLSIYRSTDAGESWHLLPAEFQLFPGMTPGITPRPYQLILDPHTRRQLFLATQNGLWLSTDAGLHWRIAGSALADVTVTAVWAHPRQRGQWVAIGPAGIWRTANAGTQWMPLHQGLPVTSRVNELVSLQKGRVLLALNGGAMPTGVASGQPLWRSTDHGQSWMPAMRGLQGLLATHLQTSDPNSSIVLAQSSQELLRSDDAGRSWQARPLPAGSKHVLSSDKGQWVFAGGEDGVWVSTDGGNTWQQSSLRARVQALARAADDALLAIVDTAQGARVMFRSTDQGQQWAEEGPAPGGLIQHFLTHPTDPQKLLIAVYWDGLYVSADGGRIWRHGDAGIPAGVHWRGTQPEQPTGPNLVALAIDPEDNESWWASRDGGGLYHSVNAGLSWDDASGDLGNNLVHDFLFAGADLLAVASRLGLMAHGEFSGATPPPTAVDIRLEILWPHQFASVGEAQQANLGLRLYRSRSLEPPPCAWTPNVEVWTARDAEPVRRLHLAEQRTIAGHPFPFWELNDIDVRWSNDPAHKQIFMARMAPGQALSASSVWIHAADARTWLPAPPEPVGLTSTTPTQIDALIRVVWPHDAEGRYAAVSQASLVNVSALLVARDTLLALAPDHLPERVWLVGAFDNQVGRRLAVGQARELPGAGFAYTTYEFNNIDVRLARDPSHHWAFWLEVPGWDVASNVWVHGMDGRTRSPQLLNPVTSCQP